MTALAKDAYARSALVTMACALAAAGVPKRFGSLFGEEWTTPAFQLLPPPGRCFPLHLSALWRGVEGVSHEGEGLSCGSGGRE